MLFTFNRAPIDDNDAFDAGGLRFEVVEPTEHLRSTFEGRMIELADARSMSDPSKAFRESPRRDVSLDLDHRAVGPMYGGSRSKEEESRSAESQFAKAHYEQHMAVEGTIEVDGERFEISGHGLRDHSWGPRHWQAIHGYEWLTMNFGPDFGAMISVIRRDDQGDEKRTGVIIENGEFDLITEVEIDADYEADGLYHKAVRVSVKTGKGKHFDIEGEVKGFIPLRNRREGLVTHIGEGMTEWRCGDQVGYGLSEFLRQVGG